MSALWHSLPFYVQLVLLSPILIALVFLAGWILATVADAFDDTAI